MLQSEPEELQEGEWHVPYVPTIRFGDGSRVYCAWVNEINDKYATKTFEEITEEQALKVSASCCAQVSFRKSDTSVEKAERIYDMLVSSKPVHASPFESQATPMRDSQYIQGCPSWQKGVTHQDRGGDYWSGNFKGWIQHRQLISDNTVWEYDGNS